MLGVFLVSGFMVEPVWVLSWEVSTHVSTNAQYDASMSDPERIPRIHPLEDPFIWFILQAVQYGVATFLLSVLLPDDVPVGMALVTFVALVVGLAAVNHWIRRRLIPH